uniref:Uncharacterized protein n=1 Tax=Tanacetum cinerariifolium TaxID=118510 RepID=A0A6L2P9I9_TANCI|nr:hypothetical protein [Tanacetum cinerariifolium]
MGEAGKWFRNLLLGKNEQEKLNTKDGDGCQPHGATTSIIPATPKSRWSFRRSNNMEKLLVNHKSCLSFDSLITSQLVSQALFDYAIHQQNHQTIRKVAATTKACYRVSRADAMTAATKIQVAFCSYLARKALCALGGLVKLQTLVRGHLVRKRTLTMVTYMSALVAIQVRAGFKGIKWPRLESRAHTLVPALEEMIKMRDLGANTPTGVPYTEKEILAMVIMGKQRVHIPGVGRQGAEKAKEEAKRQKREIDLLRRVAQLGSQSKISGAGGESGNGGVRMISQAGIRTPAGMMTRLISKYGYCKFCGYAARFE